MSNESKLDQLCQEVAKILKVDTADPDCPLGQLGVDSLNVVELILVCQTIYPNVMNLENINFDEHTTLREIDQYMKENSVSD